MEDAKVTVAPGVRGGVTNGFDNSSLKDEKRRSLRVDRYENGMRRVNRIWICNVLKMNAFLSKEIHKIDEVHVIFEIEDILL